MHVISDFCFQILDVFNILKFFNSYICSYIMSWTPIFDNYKVFKYYIQQNIFCMGL
jgi:hypothetical protein